MQPLVGQESVNTEVHFDVFFHETIVCFFYLLGFRVLQGSSARLVLPVIFGQKEGLAEKFKTYMTKTDVS